VQPVWNFNEKSRLPEDRLIRSAAVSALVYVVLATLYILVSGRFAALLAGSLEQLQTIEAVKGLVFVGVTGALFFLISLGWWRTARHQRNLLIQGERRAVASMYGATLAHDLNNLLMGLTGLVEELKEHESGNDYLARLRGAVEQSLNSLAPLSKRLASTARQFQPGDRAEVDLAATLPQVAELARRHPDVRFCTLRVGDVPPIVLPLHKELFEQAVLNLIVNAAQAAGSHGQIELVAKRDSRAIAIEVHDNGPGILPDKLDSIFTAGFTTKGDGSGLGLLSVQAFAATCRARISVAPSPLGGAVFQLAIPLEATAADPPVPSKAPPS
jgi:signal transduction histidine kinase